MGIKTRITVAGLSIAAAVAYGSNVSYHTSEVAGLREDLQQHRLALNGLQRKDRDLRLDLYGLDNAARSLLRTHYQDGVSHTRKADKSPEWIARDLARSKEIREKEIPLIELEISDHGVLMRQCQNRISDTEDEIKSHKRRALTVF